eukprot:CAMPEP_0171092058 /NCGR_PEP_ID=MMETSP0766_2-20121228/35476_1 /TAXON_ID=439317 /ORGANISM="Gambierdiscus australes, Strain CAWD 149" /LENGTH=146 /DNA_ID=CAMNT_0011550253 /DNA_START=78 /DNA_END=515 /DNA_ORIENTATION=+
MPYQRGDRVPEPHSRRGRAQVAQRTEGKSAVEEHFGKAQSLEPQALEKLKAGSMYEALELFTQIKKELAEAAYAAGPGSTNYSMLVEASAATQQNIDFINGYLPYEFLMEPNAASVASVPAGNTQGQTCDHVFRAEHSGKSEQKGG